MRTKEQVMKKIICLGIIGMCAYWYSRLCVSKRRFIKELLKQAPYMVPRYFV
jgi:hypothetical protein